VILGPSTIESLDVVRARLSQSLTKDEDDARSLEQLIADEFCDKQHAEAEVENQEASNEGGEIVSEDGQK
jgi:hypothetical protein